MRVERDETSYNRMLLREAARIFRDELVPALERGAEIGAEVVHVDRLVRHFRVERAADGIEGGEGSQEERYDHASSGP